jgi:hypothetical protein
MVCYVVPLVVAVAVSVVWGLSRQGAKGFWLSLLLYGGSVFGVVDHVWHGELFLISSNWSADLALGGVITGAMFGAWGFTIGLAKIRPSLAQRTGILRQYKQ